jgi:hypothetical protein
MNEACMPIQHFYTLSAWSIGSAIGWLVLLLAQGAWLIASRNHSRNL